MAKQKFQTKSLKRKRAAVQPEAEQPKEIILPAQRPSDEPIPKKSKWKNKQRVLVLCARGISHRDRHLLRDIKTLMPHHRAEPKMERWKTLSIINEMAEMKHCNKAILFEGRHKRDLYMWASNAENGPSVKFLVESLSTMGELRMSGNCLKGSRPLLSFDAEFTRQPHLALIKELFVQIFGVPNHHPKSQPFIDHVYTFSYLDKRIWFRNFQILSEDGGLVEIGPRFVLNPVKIFDGSFHGEALWENPDYVSPAKYRQALRKDARYRYENRVEQKVKKEVTRPTTSYALDELGEIFANKEEKEAAMSLLAKENGRPPTKKAKKAASTSGFLEEDA